MYSLAQRIAETQHIPFKLLVENQDLRQIILANHLHHKISKQHQAVGLGIQVDNQGNPTFPIAKDLNRATHQAVHERISLDDLKSRFTIEHSGRIARIEFLSNGLELHDAKKWDVLRPFYQLTVKNNHYVHIDTLTGKEEIIGEAGKNYLQVVNVQPWGWKFRGGSLFGHSWIRFVIDGQLYHTGGNLSGEIVNPDFMAAVPMKGKKWSTSSWETLDDSNQDSVGYTQSQRIFKRLEALQDYLKHRKFSQKGPYDLEVKTLYDKMRSQYGGTCTSAALTVHKEVTGKDLLDASRPKRYRILFSSPVTAVLDCIWYLVPSFIEQRLGIIRAVSRGARPQGLGSV